MATPFGSRDPEATICCLGTHGVVLMTPISGRHLRRNVEANAAILPSGGHRTDLTVKVAAHSEDPNCRRGHTSRNVWSPLSYGLDDQDGGDRETFAALGGRPICLLLSGRAGRKE